VDNFKHIHGFYFTRGVLVMKKSNSFSTIATMAAAGLMTFALAATPARAQVGFVHIGQAPPPLRYEARPPMPGPGFAWIDGYWEPWQGRYRWHPGRWDRAPYEGAYYVHPHYDHYPDGWHMHEGYWGREDHDTHYWDRHRDGDRGRDHDNHRDPH
jgi:hypothetical protein